MTSVSPIAGVAPLPVVAAEQPISLHAALAGGANLGGNASTSADYGLPQIAGVNAGTTGVASANGTVPGAAASVTAGGAQAVQGAAAVNPEQLVPVLQQLISVVQQLIVALQAQGGVTGGGAAGAVGQCGMAGCTMDHGATQAMEGAAGAPKAASTEDATQGAAKTKKKKPAANAAPAQAGAAPAQAGSVDPGSVKDKSSAAGLTAASKRGLEEAHKHGIPLVSGKRGGGTAGSDHPSGNAIDVSTLPIGAAGSTQGTPDMIAYAEHMREAGKAGQLDVKYVIHNGQIASATDNWAWRPYTYPGKSASEMEAMKSSNRGEYNRMQHYDHVHVSFG